ncbi:MAG: hypothetical protein MK078_13310 [Crocinitomicaceae bacterium]|nr:hypothetical protein [Crocinitomicaceae bacterium]
MIKKFYIGVLSLISLLSFLVMLIFLSTQDLNMPSLYLKLTGGTFIATIIYSALFAIRSFDPTFNKKVFLVYFLAGTLLTITGFAIVFDAIKFSDSWNYFVAAMVIFVLFSGLSIMDWHISKSMLVKISGIVLIVCMGFIAILFITLWTSHLLGIWLDVATYASFASMALGIIFSRRGKRTKTTGITEEE